MIERVIDSLNIDSRIILIANKYHLLSEEINDIISDIKLKYNLLIIEDDDKLM
jgi:hypothetical protein